MRKQVKMKPIQSISGKIKNSNKDVDIELNGKNLIIAGGNGSGKTSLVSAIHQTLTTQIIQQQIRNIPNYERNIKTFTEALSQPNLDPATRLNYEQSLLHSQQALDGIIGPLKITYNNDPNLLIDIYIEKKASIRFFAAGRMAEISSVSSATASQPDINSIDINARLGGNLEQHLVNLKVRSALAMQAGEEGKRPVHAEEWIASFTENLKYLFEDQSTELHFAPDQLRFYISQNGKPRYNFQSLSSGYLAIFEIYADLLMHTEYAQIKPSELTGIVVIDEIDAHLHVSLQRKILPFFTSSFPAIQFIVTTHSPFVLTSVDDAVIFDISTCQTVLNLSMYSYESVAEGLLGVPPISKIFEDTIKKLTKITSTDFFDLKLAEDLLNTIAPHIDVLDAESEMFYQIAANKIIKMKAEN
ncbi:AAA family ATPase [Pseudomonas extremaustralis]|uniref:AAA family ATPase n=1 Tax=Pseudomonas extremaustralis TaxID=359110 RepID=UPI002857F0C6|nr:AAA family ATPase [Pseudomonas extremaustralis]MDR6578492.1 energy-coupling factor transporter ATP-binding protein EcfA2 [Pseudomonas extremaustralis]